MTQNKVTFPVSFAVYDNNHCKKVISQLKMTEIKTHSDSSHKKSVSIFPLKTRTITAKNTDIFTAFTTFAPVSNKLTIKLDNFISFVK